MSFVNTTASRRFTVPYASPGLLWAGATALFAVNVALHYPGRFNNDAIGQYQQALSGQFTDWHPPIMAYLWSLLLPIWNGPQPIFLLQLVLHWLGFALVADGLRRAERPTAAWLMLAAGAFPVFVEINAELLKDVGMASAWIAASGLLFWYRVQDRKPPWLVVVAAVILILYGMLIRANAVFGFGVLLVYACFYRPSMSTMRLIMTACVLAVIAIPVSNVFNRQVLGARPTEPLDSLLLFDLVGIARHSADTVVLPLDGLSAQEIRKCYRPYMWDTLAAWGNCPQILERFKAQVATTGQNPVLLWLDAIAQHPWAYIEHRLKHFNSELNFLVPSKQSRFVPLFAQSDSSPEVVRDDYFRKSALTWPVTWIVAGLCAIALLWRARATVSVGFARVLLVSGLVYSAAYAVVGVAAAVRYYYWPIMAVLVGLIVAWPEIAAIIRRRPATGWICMAALVAVVAAGLATRIADYTGLIF
ncbi:MAG: hypothetical protein JSR91_00530 [Proteobacteria bacterium]|nr:hypothetical protein [Pseudomonadota bacterium]